MMKTKEDSFHLGVKALIRNPNKEILLLEKSAYWDLPGGRLQKGESLLDALSRETKEEIGLNNLGHIQPFITILTDIRIQVEDVGLVFAIYLCDVNHPFSPQLTDEHISFKWLPALEIMKKLTQYPIPFHDALAYLD
jgi:8-oxo-dGTP diphosphatase